MPSAKHYYFWVALRLMTGRRELVRRVASPAEYNSIRLVSLADDAFLPVLGQSNCPIGEFN